ncbi:MAG: CbiX/SirB N-terminal domain-containing protein [Clostridiales bacterium]|nr:CbiX/SirB N-terminal domain-containing protein [Clostridiales bacterium]
MKKAVVVLAMHGAPPADFPPPELAEFMSLHGRAGHGHRALNESLRLRYAELEKKMRAWPRNAQNDPFFAGSEELAEQLSRETGLEVILGFNEFCGPSLDEALDRAAAADAEAIIVVTPMMTRGGEHSEADIPAAIERAKTRHPRIKVIYAWPFSAADVARFLSLQLRKFL